VTVKTVTQKNGDRIRGARGHVYFFDGFHYPSVTTIIHKIEPEPYALTRWKQTFVHRDFASPEEYSTYASVRGTFVHYAILNKLSPVPLDGSDLPKMSVWRQWQDKIIAEVHHAKMLWAELGLEIVPPVYVETPLCHHGLWYAGTPDVLARVKYDGETCMTLIDLKTSKRPYSSHYRQIGAYAQMINEHFARANGGLLVERGMLVYLSSEMKKALVEVVYKLDIEEEIDAFNVQRDKFYATPGIIDEYGLVVPQ